MRLALLLSVVMLSSGCISTPPLSFEQRSRISAVKINRNVVKNADMYYMGPGTSALLMGGAAGGAIAGAVSAGTKKPLQDYAEKNGISIEKIVLEELSAALRASGKVKVEEIDAPFREASDTIVSPSGTTTETIMHVAITQWGFSIPQGFSSQLVPVVSVLCFLVDDKGAVIWRGTSSVLPLKNPVAPMSLETIRDNPVRIETAWRIASKQVVRNIVRNF